MDLQGKQDGQSGVGRRPLQQLRLCSSLPEDVKSQGRVLSGALTSVMINTVGLHKSHSDGLAQWVIILLQLRLPEDGVSVLIEVLLGSVASRELSGAILLAKHLHPIQTIVADVVAGDVRQAGRHHPHATALVSWGS